MHDKLKDSIAWGIEEYGPLKGEDLEYRIGDVVSPYTLILDELVKEGRIVEAQYTTPHLDHRTRSMYFPKAQT
jgi:hypothetical protein